LSKGKIQNGGAGGLVAIAKVIQPIIMKRHGNLYAKIANIDNIRIAYLKARKGKGWQRTIKRFDVNLNANLEAIYRMLADRKFNTSPYKTKIINEPKRREIFILPFAPDRIVQHALMNVVEPIWEGLFIHDSYACRVGKGIHAGSRRTMEFVRRNRYCLQCDVSKFYPSIDHDTLFSIIQNKIKCSDTLAMIKNIVYSTEGPRNVPIGNYTSQWFGNLYLNELDSFVKQKCQIKDYIRYCDDFLLFHDDKRHLHEIKDELKAFVDARLSLRLRKDSIFPVSQGVDFLGYRHFRGYILLRKSTAKRVIKRLRKMPEMLASGRLSKDRARASLASTRGWLRWANAHNLSLSLEMDKLMELCDAA